MSEGAGVNFCKRLWRAAILVCVAVLLTGCPRLYIAFEKHGGAFLATPRGPQFVHLGDEQWDRSKNALIYFYRPYSDWAAEEIDAPTVYIDDTRYISMRGNGYSWLEVTPGTRRITLRRPLGAVLGFEGFGDFNLSLILDTTFEVEAGGVYYFRYSEVSKPKVTNPALEPDDPLTQGDMQLVTWDVAFPEIVNTRFMESRPPFAKNTGGANIVSDNMNYVFKKAETEIKEARAEEIARLKEEGHYRPNKWWCLYMCGGSPTKRVKADAELRKLEKRREAWEHEMALNEKDDTRKWYWPF